MNEKDRKSVFFFIGTEAELIKVFPVIIECRKSNMDTYIIASGQNDIEKSSFFQLTDIGRVDIKLSEEKTIKKSASGLMSWWLKTYFGAVNKIKSTFSAEKLKNALMVVHGDTVSTYMGAKLGKKLGMTVCHIEAGLRSHCLFDPFPEEIDRLLTSRLARMHFAPGDEAEQNLKNIKGKVINTKHNTLLDSLRISEGFPINDEKIERIVSSDKPYFVFIMHRQENLANEKFVRDVIERIEKIANNCHAIIILHTITRNTLKKFGLSEGLRNNKNITLLPRVDYFDFMKLLKESEFVITDGGSNQEELYYMGKPTLIMRKTTERSEGIGENARLYRGIEDIEKFASQYNKMSKKAEKMTPVSIMIVDEFINK